VNTNPQRPPLPPVKDNRLFFIFCYLLFLSITPCEAAAPEPHYVFAHYMVCFATYGESIPGYQREMREAQDAGIDGFALNIGAWDSSQSYYQRRVALIYRAAEQLGTGFKLFFSVDLGDADQVINMVETYARRNNSFRFRDHLVLSTYGQNDVPSMKWTGIDWTNVLRRLKVDGIPVFFTPFFLADPLHELPNYDDGARIVNKYSAVLDGLFWWGAAGLPHELAQCNSNYTKAVHAVGKISMASYAPHYWGHKQPSIGRRYYETEGGKGTVLQWQSIIVNQPDWVEITTWNDFAESTYICPHDNPGLSNRELMSPRRYSHKGYLELAKHYIAWFKTGKEPAIDRDALFYFYRTHPKDAKALDKNDQPVTWRFGDVQDVIYTTAFLTAPAELEVASGSVSTMHSLPAGLSHQMTPAETGPQRFTLRRDSQLILTEQGPEFVGQVRNYDFFPASGYVVGAAWP
jgi:glucan endo-1,3-alpha-glucosidase